MTALHRTQSGEGRNGDDPAHYRWTNYRANALGQIDTRLTPHALYLSFGTDDKQRQAAYRALFRAQLDRTAIDYTRLSLNQHQPLGNERFYARIEEATGVRREAKVREQPLRAEAKDVSLLIRQGQLEL